MDGHNKLGVLWDMDGVLVDTGELHYRSWKETLDEAGIPFDRDVFRETFGMNNAGILEHLLGEKPDQELVNRISEQKERIFRDLVPGNVQTLPGVIPWLARLQQSGARMAVASSAPSANIELMVEELNIRPYFQALVSGADLPGKPDPATFLEAARPDWDGTRAMRRSGGRHCRRAGSDQRRDEMRGGHQYKRPASPFESRYYRGQPGRAA